MFNYCITLFKLSGILERLSTLMFTYSLFKLSANIMVEKTFVSFTQPLSFLYATALQLMCLSVICTNVKTANCVTHCHVVGVIMLLVQASAA